MRRINHFKPNVKPTHEYAKRQWSWNYLGKIKKKMIQEGNPLNKQDFVNAALAMNMFDKAKEARRAGRES